MLSKLVYLALCRSIALFALLARGDPGKDLEILVLRHQLTVLRRQLPRPQLEPADRALLAAISRSLPRTRWSCFVVTPDTLLRWHRRLVVGRWTYPHRRPGRPPLDENVQQLIVRLAGESPLGLPAHQGRAAPSRRARVCNRDPQHTAPPRARPGATACAWYLPGVSAPAGRRDHRLRCLHRGHGMAATAVRADLHRTGYPTGAPGWGDRQPGRRVGHPAGPQPAAGIGRARSTDPIRAARPRREVLPELRRRWSGASVRVPGDVAPGIPGRCRAGS